MRPALLYQVAADAFPVLCALLLKQIVDACQQFLAQDILIINLGLHQPGHLWLGVSVSILRQATVAIRFSFMLYGHFIAQPSLSDLSI